MPPVRCPGCQSDVGTAYQAQAYNIIKALDPYHAIIGASDCGDTWVFFDQATPAPTNLLAVASCAALTPSARHRAILSVVHPVAALRALKE